MIKDVATIRRALKNNLYTYNLAEHFKKLVRQNIDALGHAHSSGHNTPTQLISFLKGPIKDTGNYLIKIDPYMTQTKSTNREFNVVELVEKGTKPHWIPRYVDGNLVSLVDHPGATGRWFWRKAVTRFNSDAEDKAVREVSKETKRTFKKK